MGTAYLYKCSSCQHELTCSSGLDRGIRIQVKPMRCTVCGNTGNTLIARFESRNDPPVPLNELVCGTCKSIDSFEDWDLITCPKCNQKTMTQTSGITKWD